MIKNNLLIVMLSIILVFVIGLSENISADEVIELQISRPGTPDKVRAFLEPAIEAFEEENSNITVEIIDMGWGEWYNRMIALFASKEAPDVRMTALSTLTYFNDQGAFYPLNEFIKDSPELKERVIGNLWDMSTIDGEILQVPTSVASFALYYRKDILEEAGLNNPPDNFNEIIEYSRIISENTDSRGLGIHAGGDTQTVILYNILYGKELLSENAEILFDNEETINTLTGIEKMVNNNWTNPDVTSYPSRGDLRPMFRDGDVAMVIDGPWFLPMLREAELITEDEENSTVGITVEPLITGDRRTGLGNDGWVIDKHTDHPEEAWKLIEFLTKPEWQHKHELEYGLIPAQHDTAEMETFETWYWHPFIEGLENAYRPHFLNILDTSNFNQIMIDGLQQAYIGHVSPEEAIDYLVNEIKRGVRDIE